MFASVLFLSLLVFVVLLGRWRKHAMSRLNRARPRFRCLSTFCADLRQGNFNSETQHIFER